jgi:hypothetical protein
VASAPVPTTRSVVLKGALPVTFVGAVGESLPLSLPAGGGQ